MHAKSILIDCRCSGLANLIKIRTGKTENWNRKNWNRGNLVPVRFLFLKN